METLPKQIGGNIVEQLTLPLLAPPVRTSPLPDSGPEWQELVATSPLSSFGFLMMHGPDGWCGRTSPDSCLLTEDGRLEPSSEGWRNSGMGSPTGFLTLNTSEWNHTLAPSLKDDGVCSLSDILEIGALPQRFFLSAKACAGILRRAERRGKALPTMLHRALAQVAGDLNEEETPGGKTL